MMASSQRSDIEEGTAVHHPFAARILVSLVSIQTKKHTLQQY